MQHIWSGSKFLAAAWMKQKLNIRKLLTETFYNCAQLFPLEGYELLTWFVHCREWYVSFYT